MSNFPILYVVILLLAGVVPWLLPPSMSICAVRHILHPLVLALCFSILLVKTMQLKSLMTIGLGGSLPQINQLMSLLFMLSVQVVIVVEWYLSTSPIEVILVDQYPMCDVGKLRFVLLHIYHVS